MIKSANRGGQIALYKAVLADSSVVIEILPTIGADVNAATKTGMTALHVLGIAKHKQLVACWRIEQAVMLLVAKTSGQLSLEYQ